MRRIRVVAWVVILSIAVFQAYAQRYAVSPDGISYLDLSDAVVTRDWRRLVNLYWSPLYPALIGVARAVFGASAAREVPLVHAVNLVSFIAMFVAFEYMLGHTRSGGARETPFLPGRGDSPAHTRCSPSLASRWCRPS
jgi:hypothetical protein